MEHNYLAKVDHFFQAATQPGLVIELPDSYTDNFNFVDTLNSPAGNKIQNNPNVWIETLERAQWRRPILGGLAKGRNTISQTTRNVGFANPV
jgi:hypothetical protein